MLPDPNNPDHCLTHTCGHVVLPHFGLTDSLYCTGCSAFALQKDHHAHWLPSGINRRNNVEALLRGDHQSPGNIPEKIRHPRHIISTNYDDPDLPDGNIQRLTLWDRLILWWRST